MTKADQSDGLALLDYARATCGVHVDEECLPPDVEAEAALAFRALAAWLEAFVARARIGRAA
jgi:hypothetical protein